MRRPWLLPYDWKMVVKLNEQLCAGKQALHKPTSDGYDTVMTFWTAQHPLETDLLDALHLCRRAHKGAPFVNFNGNTFTAIARQAIQHVLGTLAAPEAAILRSQAGHYVAGTIGQRDLESVLLRLVPASPPPPAADTASSETSAAG